MEDKKAVIFDMDGVIADNNPYHIEAFRIFCRRYRVPIGHIDFKKNIFGKTNSYIFTRTFGIFFQDQDIEQLSQEKEAIYRDIYEKQAKAMPGLTLFLQNIGEKYKIGLATNAPRENMEFTVETLNIKYHFDDMIYAKEVKQGKPAPDIYLAMAERLGVKPENCVVFEDSLTGIEAAQAAGMKVVGVTSTYTHYELSHTDYTIRDFNDMTTHILERILLKGKKKKS